MTQQTTLKRKTSPFRYGFAMFGTSIPINMFKSFAAIYYVDTLGLDMKQYALIPLIYAFVDAIDNPVYGFLSDNTRTKWGRRRPWLLIGTPLLVLFFILFYNVPTFVQSDKGMLFIYMLLMYILTGTLDSLVNANYGSLFIELFRKDEDRAKTNGIRQICQLFAMAISIALTPMITEAIGYQLTSVIYGVLALAVMMYCFWGCRETQTDYEEMEKPKLLSSIIALVTNPRFWIFGLAGAFYSAAFSLISQALPFYVKYTLGLGGSTTTIMLGIVLGVAVLGIVMWSKLAKKIPIMTVWRTGFILMAIGFVPLFFTNSLPYAIAIAAFMGIGIAACLTTMDCIGAKIVDDDYRKHGIKREGIINSLMGVMNRLNGLYISLAFYVTSELFGFVSGDEPGENPAMAARVLLCVFPAAAMAVASAVTFFLKFPEDKKENG
ncbi:MAG: MFS transporter [Clostridia bacterium]|nr:MFS transporter [Clostridia bacterium]MBR2417035.1 MFS transporter [Clostridia bacterium]